MGRKIISIWGSGIKWADVWGKIISSLIFLCMRLFYAKDDEIDLKKKSEERMVEVYKLLGDSDTEKSDIIMRAIDRGYEPAGISVAVEILGSL